MHAKLEEKNERATSVYVFEQQASSNYWFYVHTTELLDEQLEL
jgi:hypothetical protein